MIDNDDFFLRWNSENITKEDLEHLLKNKGAYVEMGSAVESIFFGSLFVTNHHDNSFIYKSRKPHPLSEFYPIQPGKDIAFHNCLQMGDKKLRREISRCLYRLYSQLTMEERRKIILYMNFNVEYEGKEFLTSFMSTPLLIGSEGALVASLGMLSFPLYKDRTKIMMYVRNSPWLYEYSLKRHEWVKIPIPTINSSEKRIIQLSMLGLKTNEIATTMNLSENTVKGYKKETNRKLRAENIQQAIIKSLYFLSL